MATKKEILLDLLERIWVYLQVNGTAPGVDLPDGLRTPAVPLQIGYNMPLPIPDLKIDDWGVTCTLSFRRTPHTCRIPWNAIFAFTDGEGGGVVFPEDIPPVLQAAIAQAEATAGDGKAQVTTDLGPAAEEAIASSASNASKSGPSSRRTSA